MKTITKILPIILLSIFLFATTSVTYAANKPEKATTEMRILGQNRVTAGNTLTAQFSSNLDTQAQLVVENASGKRYVETNLSVDQGLNTLKLKVSEIPEGIYFISLTNNGATEKIAFIVQNLNS